MITQETRRITNIKTVNGEVTIVNPIAISDSPSDIINMAELLIEKTDADGYDSGLRVTLAPDEIDELIQALKTAKKQFSATVVQ